MLYKIEHIEYLWALLLVPVWALVMLGWWRWRRSLLSEIPASIRERLIPGISGKIAWIKAVFLALFFVFSTVALINPKVGSKVEKVKRKGVDVVFALDVSKSMLAEDAVPNRLERSVQIIRGALDRLASDRVGLVIYAGAAYPQLPITTDYGAARMFLEQVSTEGISSQGTAVAEALDLGLDFYDQNLETNRIMFVLSDGEDHESGLDPILSRAQEEKVLIHCLGVGTSSGAPIPEKKNGRTIGYKTDRDGQTVLTKLNRSTLTTIAAATGGQYIPVLDTRDAVDAIITQIESLEKKEIEARVFSDYKDQFQWFLAIAMLFLLMETVLPNKRMRQNLFRSALLFAVLIPAQSWSQTPGELIRSGNEKYESGAFGDASELYYRSIDAEKNNPKAWFNLGDAQYEQQAYDQAESSFKRAIDLTEDPQLKSRAQHNLGNIYFNKQDYARALDAYKNSLKNDPTSEATRQNYALTKRLLQEQQNQENQKNQENQDQQDQQKNEENQQDQKQNQEKQEDRGEDSKNQEQQSQEDGSQQDSQQKNQPGEEEQQPQPKPGEMSREAAERLLKALENQERKVQDKLKEERMMAQPKTREKDW